jgi:hypothetical protein
MESVCCQDGPHPRAAGGYEETKQQMNLVAVRDSIGAVSHLFLGALPVSAAR